MPLLLPWIDAADMAMVPPRADGVQYSIVVPVFDEEAVLPILLKQLDTLVAARCAAETIFVDDGGADSSWIVVRGRRTYPRYRYVRLTRDFPAIRSRSPRAWTPEWARLWS